MVTNTTRTDKSTDNRTVLCNYCPNTVVPIRPNADVSICRECIEEKAGAFL